MTKIIQSKKADQYNDPKYNYLQYWDGRIYEHKAEEIAIYKLLNNKHFNHAVDVGGGYGRLCIILRRYADKVTLVEPSIKQLNIAKTYLKNYPEIEKKEMAADNLDFKTGSVDLITFIRVLHHLPTPDKELNEISRVLSKNGLAIIEMANYAHFLNRVRLLSKGKKLPKEPVDIRSAANKSQSEIAFVNHNPKEVIKKLNQSGFKVIKVLSVSNLRNPKLKKVIPRFALLGVEHMFQSSLSKIYFGPSIFFLVKKA